MERFISGELKNIFRIHSNNLFIGLMADGKHVWQQEEEINRKRFQYCTDDFRNKCLFPSSSRTFRTQSYWSFITGQCYYSEQLVPAYMHKAWKKHQNTVYWVDIRPAQKKGLKFYQTRSNAIILHETLPAYCIPKVVRMETGEVIYEKVYMSPRPPSQISLKHD